MSIPPPTAERRCPNCGQPITPTAILCPYCGTSVAESVWPPPLSNRIPGITQAAKPIAGGILASSGVAAVIVGLNDWLVRRSGLAWGTGTMMTPDPTLVASDFLLVPLVMGIVCAYFWRNLGMRTGQYFLFSLLNSAVALIVSAFFMGEGMICLIIVSPLILLLTFAGSLLGRALFNRNNRTLQLSLIPLILIVMVSDSLSTHEYRNSVSDRVIIHASPSTVWQHLAAIPDVSEPPDYWLFKMGLPYPVGATVAQSPAVGVERQCVFSGDLVFDERITEYVPDKRLTFDIVHQPDHPEILGHAAVKRGQFVLQDNHDGTTTLIGTSWYELYVYPSWYYDFWASSIARQVHLRVMDHIKTVCEAPNTHV